MNVTKALIPPTKLCILLLVASAVSLPLAAASAVPPVASAQAQAAAPAPARKIGAIKAISGTSITLAPDSGPEVVVMVQPATRLLRISPGEKNLKNATPVQLQDLQVGDRILVGGQASDDAKSIAAATIVVMAHSDLEARHQQELQDWQKRGMGGPVSSVDPATGIVTISITSLAGGVAGKKSVAIHTTKDTVIRRYAPDSVKFEDAKPSSVQEIRPGDQLRARGDRNPDGTELAAEEIVTGVFRSLAGTINSVDASSGTINVQDLQSKKPVQVKVTADSALHKLPAEMAQRFAARLKGAAGIAGLPGSGGAGPGGARSGGAGSGTAGANPAAGASGTSESAVPGAPSGDSPAGGTRGGGGGGLPGGTRSGGAPDFQQMLSFTPAVAIADLHKGDAVVILATEGTPSSASTVITLVSGVEPILQAAPSASQAMMLAPWSLGGAPGGGEGNQ
ncbi:MAG TPA: DUF5666 domain-containing protein [Candidatus Sulfotelmatobacter sp.]|nr:DUF5666 domain-containing protein [Candidatus Sulfotelmatobacter sp.]